MEIFTRFFESIVEQCQQAREVRGREVFADATKVEANAALDSLKPRFAIEEHLKALFSGEPDGGPSEPLASQTRLSADEGTAPPLLHPHLPVPLTEQLSQ